MMLDVFLSSAPYRIAHCYHSMAYSLLFLTFSWVYYQLGGVNGEGHRYIYPQLDWTYREYLV